MADMEQTRDPNLTPEFFSNKALEFFTIFNSQPFTDWEGALEFIDAADVLADTIITAMQEGATAYTDDTLVIFGSPLGEAFKILFGGGWHYAEEQERWVIRTKTPERDRMDINVFNKFEKRLVNGMEDSISYYMRGMAKMLLEGGPSA
jgi:hypothetical protein